MNGQLTEQLRTGATSEQGQTFGKAAAAGNFQQQIQDNITQLHSGSRAGLWGIIAFLAVSACALMFRDVGMFNALPADLQAMLGDPLPAVFIHAVLGVSTLSSFIIIMGRIAEGAAPGKVWQQVTFQLFFYFLYLAANALDQYAVLIFACGLLILGLDHYNRWSWFRKAIQKEKDTLRKLALWPLAALQEK